MSDFEKKRDYETIDVEKIVIIKELSLGFYHAWPKRS